MTPKNKAQQRGAFDALTEAAVAQQNDDTAAEKMSKARASLVMGRSPKAAFFASLALKKELVPQRGLGTCMTNGKKIFYDPDYVAGLELPELLGTVCHEVLHTAMAHHARIGNRDPKLWNVACDLAINPVLDDAGFQLPAGVLYPGRGDYAHVPAGLSAEAIYPYLLKPQEQEQDDQPDEQDQGDNPGAGQAGGQPDDEPGEGDGDQPGDGAPSGEKGQPGNDPGKCGGVQAPPDTSPASLAHEEAEAQMDLAAAEMAGRQRGDLGAGLKRLCDEIVRPKVDWRDVLREFVSRRVKSEYRWDRPNRRFIADELYLPSRSGETVGDLVVTVDTSGSIGAEVLSEFSGCIDGILSSWPHVRLTVLYHDVGVTRRDEWTPDEGPFKLDPVGGGGTSHVPVFAEIGAAEEPPSAVICLTDCHTDYPDSAGGLPVLWCVVGNKNARPPFGQVIHLED